MVTGATGYIGGRLVEQLLREGEYEVVALVRSAALAHYSCQRQPSVRIGDIAEPDFDAALACQDIETVIHLAGLPAASCADNPLAAVQTNIAGTVRLVDGAKVAGVRRFVQLSTIHVYGEPAGREIDEETPAAPRHPYAIAHLAAEQFAIESAKEGFSVAVVRLSNAFGRPHHPDVKCWNLVTNDLCRQAVERRGMELRSSGYQHRDFVPMTRVVEVVIDLAQRHETAIHNLGWGGSSSLREVAQMVNERVCRLYGAEVGIRYGTGGLPDRTPAFRFFNRRQAPWRAQESGSLEDEIDACLAYCEEHFDRTGEGETL